MKTFAVFLLMAGVACADLSASAPTAVSTNPSSAQAGNLPDTNLAVSPETSALEEGKTLYENGQMIAALGKFMTVLRNEPRNPEARQYLRMIVDTMRQNPSISASRLGAKDQAVSSNPVVQEEIRRMLQLRARLTMDLKAIPSVQVSIKGNTNQVWIESPLLFADKSGALKEQGIPVLDRVAAWLKTYGQQPVIIHCYPEELQETSTNGSLFLHRYSELFRFFVDEKKLNSQRFVSADLLQAASDDVSISTSAARVVIETIGSQSAVLEAMPSMNSSKALSQWLENSITANRRAFNPEEGEWVTLDLAAITRAGLRKWNFMIVPAEKKNPAPVFQLEGIGNVLKRLNWDGHDQKSGEFVRSGNYAARMTAINSDGTIKTREEILRVERSTKDAPAVLIQKPPKKKAKSMSAKKKAPKAAPVVPAKAASAPPAAPAAEEPGATIEHSSKPVVPPAPAATEASPADNPDTLVDAAPAAEEEESSSQAIWKQVIQFEPGQSNLKPTIKASLERIGKTLEVYPLQKVRITGFAMNSESNAEQLAQKRADVVRSILVNEYRVDKKRVINAGGKTTSRENGSKVEMSITN